MGSNDLTPVVLAAFLVPLVLGMFTLFVFYAAKKISQVFSSQSASDLPPWHAFGNLRSPSGQAALLGWMALVVCGSCTLSIAISTSLYSPTADTYDESSAGVVAHKAGFQIAYCAIPLGAFFIGALFSGPRLALSLAIPVAALWVSLRVLSDCSWHMERSGDSPEGALSASFIPALFSAAGVIAFTIIIGWVWPSSILRSSRDRVTNAPRSSEPDKNASDRVGPGSPPPPPHASAKPSNESKILTEADFFRQVAQELKAGKIEEGLWLKARSLTDGSREAAERKYVIFRVSELMADYRRKRRAAFFEPISRVVMGILFVLGVLLAMALLGSLIESLQDARP